MNHKPNISAKKRASLKRLRNIGLGSIAVSSVGLSGGWIRPVVEQVILPAHASTTPTNPECAQPQISASLGQCSAGVDITVTIKSSDATPLTVLSLPTIAATPSTVANPDGDWKSVNGAAVPAEITDTIVYNAITRGQVLNEFNNCAIPATDVPVNNGIPLTQLMFSVRYQCSISGTISTLNVDLLSLI